MDPSTPQAQPPPRVNILGVGVHATHPDEVCRFLFETVERGGGGYVCVTGVHGIMESQADEALRSIHNASLLTVPDGMPTVWLGRLKGHRGMRRTFGPDLMLKLCGEGVARGKTHFLYGGKEGVAEELAAVLGARFPGIRVVGVHCPPFRSLTEEEETELARKVREVSPDFFWVGLSTPKQERFMASHVHLGARVLLGVGAAFDLHTGRMADAPGWMKSAGLQWLHRLCQEPRRLARRYLTNNPLFIAKSFLQLLGLRKYKL